MKILGIDMDVVVALIGVAMVVYVAFHIVYLIKKQEWMRIVKTVFGIGALLFFSMYAYGAMVAASVIPDSLGITSMGNGNVLESVQNAEKDGVTYKEAFDNYFTDGAWTEFTSDEDKEIVQFDGTCQYEGSDADITLQWTVSDATFNVSYLSINGEGSDILTASILLADVFGESTGDTEEATDTTNVSTTSVETEGDPAEEEEEEIPEGTKVIKLEDMLDGSISTVDDAYTFFVNAGYDYTLFTHDGVDENGDDIYYGNYAQIETYSDDSRVWAYVSDVPDECDISVYDIRLGDTMQGADWILSQNGTIYDYSGDVSTGYDYVIYEFDNGYVELDADANYNVTQIIVVTK